LSRRVLDTNILSELIKNPHGDVAQRVLGFDPDDVCTSAIAAAELRYGAAKKRDTKLTREVQELLSEIEVLPFDFEAAQAYGKLRAALEANGKQLSPNDTLIAAHVAALDGTLVTQDTGFKQARKFVTLLLV
jgi:tRNA(fMet)-specific endonuclease VapC